MGLKENAKKLKSDLPAIFVALKKRETPILAKILATLVIVYALSPIDIIPDFIPIIGMLDDLILLPMVIALTIKLIPKEVLADCKLEAENQWRDGKPKRWFFALPIIVLWMVMLWVLVNIFI